MEEGLSYIIHKTATLDNGAQIGDRTKIWHYSHIMPNAWIGSDCVLGQNIFVASNVIIGNRVKIQNNVSLYEGLYCEDDVFIGPSAVFTNVINPRSAVERKNEYKKTILKRGATIGANATIVCGVTIGKYAFVGAGSVITKDLPDHSLFVGNPGTQMGWMSSNGQRLEFNQENIATCPISGQNYRLENNRIVELS